MQLLSNAAIRIQDELVSILKPIKIWNDHHFQCRLNLFNYTSGQLSQAIKIRSNSLASLDPIVLQMWNLSSSFDIIT